MLKNYKKVGLLQKNLEFKVGWNNPERILTSQPNTLETTWVYQCYQAAYGQAIKWHSKKLKGMSSCSLMRTRREKILTAFKRAKWKYKHNKRWQKRKLDKTRLIKKLCPYFLSTRYMIKIYLMRYLCLGRRVAWWSSFPAQNGT